MKNYKTLFNKFIKVLSLSGEPIELYLLPGTLANKQRGNSLFWDSSKNSWIIKFVKGDYDFFLAHELGHIFLSKNLNCRYFAEPFTNPDNSTISDYNNCIVDSFVNYHISTNDEIYPYFLEVVDTFLNITRFEPTTPNLLAHYINYYLDINYTLKESDKEIRNQQITTSFRNFEVLIIYSTLSNETLQKIKTKLKEFENIKSTTNKNDVIEYITHLLKLIPLWSENEVENNIRMIYNI